MNWIMLQFQEVVSMCKIEFWCQLTIAILIWENLELCFGQKYTLISRLGGGGSEVKILDVRLTFRIVFDLHTKEVYNSYMKCYVT